MRSSRVRIEQERPSERFPGGENLRETPAPLAPGRGTNVGPIIPPSTVKTGHILLIPGVGSATHSDSGNPITLKDLSTVNAAFVDFVYSYPGGAGDKNNAQWIIPIPSDMAAIPNIRIRLHLLGE